MNIHIVAVITVPIVAVITGATGGYLLGRYHGRRMPKKTKLEKEDSSQQHAWAGEDDDVN